MCSTHTKKPISPLPTLCPRNTSSLSLDCINLEGGKRWAAVIPTHHICRKRFDVQQRFDILCLLLLLSLLLLYRDFIFGCCDVTKSLVLPAIRILSSDRMKRRKNTISNLSAGGKDSVTHSYNRRTPVPPPHRVSFSYRFGERDAVVRVFKPATRHAPPPANAPTQFRRALGVIGLRKRIRQSTTATAHLLSSASRH